MKNSNSMKINELDNLTASELEKVISAPLTGDEAQILEKIKNRYKRYIATFNEEPAGWILRDMLYVEFPMSAKLILHDDWYHKQILKSV